MDGEIRKKKRKHPVYVNVENCKYEIVRTAAQKKGWKLCTDEDDVEWNLYWTDMSVTVDRILKLKDFQKINHFPGMYQISRKADLARTLNRMNRTHPEQYSFYPRSWVFPEEEAEFRDYVRKHKHKKFTYIIKPNTGCQGKGIYLTRTAESVNYSEPSVAQRYVADPLLLDGYKFDLRVYVLVASVVPLRLLLYREGLVRLCTVPYKAPKASNLGSERMHLTNYAINKGAEGFQAAQAEAFVPAGNEETASKRRLSWFLRWVDCQPDGPGAAEVWQRVAHIAAATLLAAQPMLAHLLKSCQRAAGGGMQCFEVLGFDIMIDKDFKPWLVEVNHSPSFSVDSLLDREIKLSLVSDTMRLLCIKGNDRKKHQKKAQAQAQQRLYGNRFKPVSKTCRSEAWMTYKKWEREHKGNYQVIFPPEDTREYNVFSQEGHSTENPDYAEPDIFTETQEQAAEITATYAHILDSSARLFQATAVSPHSGLGGLGGRQLALARQAGYEPPAAAAAAATPYGHPRAPTPRAAAAAGAAELARDLYGPYREAPGSARPPSATGYFRRAPPSSSAAAAAAAAAAARPPSAHHRWAAGGGGGGRGDGRPGTRGSQAEASSSSDNSLGEESAQTLQRADPHLLRRSRTPTAAAAAVAAPATPARRPLLRRPRPSSSPRAAAGAARPSPTARGGGGGSPGHLTRPCPPPPADTAALRATHFRFPDEGGGGGGGAFASPLVTAGGGGRGRRGQVRGRGGARDEYAPPSPSRGVELPRRPSTSAGHKPRSPRADYALDQSLQTTGQEGHEGITVTVDCHQRSAEKKIFMRPRIISQKSSQRYKDEFCQAMAGSPPSNARRRPTKRASGVPRPRLSSASAAAAAAAAQQPLGRGWQRGGGAAGGAAVPAAAAAAAGVRTGGGGKGLLAKDASSGSLHSLQHLPQEYRETNSIMRQKTRTSHGFEVLKNAGGPRRRESGTTWSSLSSSTRRVPPNKTF